MGAPSKVSTGRLHHTTFPEHGEGQFVQASPSSPLSDCQTTNCSFSIANMSESKDYMSGAGEVSQETGHLQRAIFRLMRTVCRLHKAIRCVAFGCRKICKGTLTLGSATLSESASCFQGSNYSGASGMSDTPFCLWLKCGGWIHCETI